MTNLELSRIARVVRVHRDYNESQGAGLALDLADALELNALTRESFLKACKDAKYATVSGRAP